MRIPAAFLLLLVAGCGQKSQPKALEPVPETIPAPTIPSSGAARAKTQNQFAAVEMFFGAQAVNNNEPKVGLTHFKDAITHYERAENAGGAALAYGKAGHTLLLMENAQEAEEYLRKSVELFLKAKLESSFDFLQALTDLAAIRIGQKRLPEAEKNLDMALTICNAEPKTPPELLLKVLNNLGEVEYLSGDYQAALAHYQAALKVSESNPISDEWVRSTIRKNVENAKAKIAGK